MMKLYDGGRAPNPRRVEIFIREKSLEIERVPVDIGKLEHKSEAFCAVNPMQALPVLELEDGTAISETMAICRYLEGVEPEPNLFGKDNLEQAVIEMWHRRIELYLFMPVAFSFRHLHPAAKMLELEQVSRWGELNQAKARKFMVFLDEELKGREFMAGDRFSVADITALTAMQFLKPAKITIPDGLTHLTRWFDAAAKRPSASIES